MAPNPTPIHDWCIRCGKYSPHLVTKTPLGDPVQACATCGRITEYRYPPIPR